MKIFAGTSGYSYDSWKGAFYPDDLPSGERLAFYAERLPAVEINNTFYRLPKAAVLANWASQVPESFRFSIKASRRITHFKRLKEAGDETSYLLRTTRELGDRLGVLLFQLHPNLRLDLPRLDAFLDLLPEGTRAAFEFRHESWADEAVHERLRERDLGLVVVDDEDTELPAVLATGRRAYFRLRRPGYDHAELAAWAQRVRGLECEEAYVFFKHEEAGAGPALAGRFLELSERAAERKGAKRAAEPETTGSESAETAARKPPKKKRTVSKRPAAKKPAARREASGRDVG